MCFLCLCVCVCVCVFPLCAPCRPAQAPQGVPLGLRGLWDLPVPAPQALQRADEHEQDPGPALPGPAVVPRGPHPGGPAQVARTQRRGQAECTKTHTHVYSAHTQGTNTCSSHVLIHKLTHTVHIDSHTHKYAVQVDSHTHIYTIHTCIQNTHSHMYAQYTNT